METTADRFISQRGFYEDASLAFTTKQQLFASPTKTRAAPKDNSSPPTGQPRDDFCSTEQEDSNKTYQALLQNQVLGIDNTYLLHEIHNSEDYHQSQQLYTRMQK